MFVALITSPLSQLPRIDQRNVARAVGRGQVSTDPTNALVSIAFARWIARFYAIGKYAFLILGSLGILLGVLEPAWDQLVVGAGFLLASLFYFVSDRRVRRSIPLNESLLRA
jgi:hypothetical protein